MSGKWNLEIEGFKAREHLTLYELHLTFNAELILELDLSYI